MPTSKPSCVVLGGGGFMGTNLCRRLVRSGHRVRAFGRHCRFPDDLRGVEWREGDFADSAAMAAAVESCDLVFHLVHSAMPQAANLAMASDVLSNIVPSLALLELCRRLGVRRIVFSSSGGMVYGRAAQVPTPESAPTEPISAYGISKLAIEKYLRLFEHLHSLDFRVLRITNPFGPYQIAWKGQGFIAAAVAHALRGKPIEIWGDGSVVRDFIFIDDVIDAFEAAASDTSDQQVFNIGTGQGRRIDEIVGALEHLLGMTLSVTRTPGRSLDIPVSIVAIDRAREFLEWSPKTPFETGLEKTIEWTRRHRADIDRLLGSSVV